MDQTESGGAGSYGTPLLRDGVGYIPLRASRTGARGMPSLENTVVVGTAMVDEADFAELSRHRWHLSDTGYACRWVGPRKARKRVRMHRFVLGDALGMTDQVDHLNRDRLDNRRANLRPVALDGFNKQNVPARAGSTSQHRGVSYDRTRQKWVAQAKCAGKRLMKRFDTEEEAADAARGWRAEHMPFSTD
jgi:hypothetical protein